MHKPQRTIKNGIIEITNPRGEHWYWSEEKKKFYPSVTMITGVYPKGVGFASWLGNQESFYEAERIKEEAGERGTRVHRAIEDILKGEKIVFDEDTEETKKGKVSIGYKQLNGLNFWQAVEEWKMLEAFQKWVEKFQPEILKTETTVISDMHEYGGTFDLACRIDGELHIVDFKTSSNIYPTHFLQVQAYAWAAAEMEMFKGETPKISVLQFNKRTKIGYKFEVHEWSADEFGIFSSCQRIWNHANPKFDGPDVLELQEVISLEKR